MFFPSLLYALVVFRNSKKQLNQQKVEKFKSSCQFYVSSFFGKKKKVRDFILAQRTEGEGSIFFNNVGSPRELFIYYVKVFWDFSTPPTYPVMHWGVGNVYLLVLSSWIVNIAKNPIAVTGL